MNSGPHVTPLPLDHIVLATPDLAATVADFARRTGVTPAPGGAHVGRGTRNHLVALGDAGYLEIIGPDPEQSEPPGPRPFLVDEQTGARPVTWAVRPADLEATVRAARSHGYDPGDIRPMSRRRPDGTLLEWRLTDGSHPSGLVPFLIDWDASAHPTDADLPVTPLVELAASHPEPERIRRLLAAVGAELPVAAGPARLSFTVDTPRGRVTFS
jgi:hypothetical protein